MHIVYPHGYRIELRDINIIGRAPSPLGRQGPAILFEDLNLDPDALEQAKRRISSVFPRIKIDSLLRDVPLDPLVIVFHDDGTVLHSPFQGAKLTLRNFPGWSEDTARDIITFKPESVAPAKLARLKLALWLLRGAGVRSKPAMPSTAESDSRVAEEGDLGPIPEASDPTPIPEQVDHSPAPEASNLSPIPEESALDPMPEESVLSSMPEVPDLDPMPDESALGLMPEEPEAPDASEHPIEESDDQAAKVF